MDYRENTVKRRYMNHPSVRENRCFYCGFYADAIDHYPALSIADSLPGGFMGLRVRCCTGCNSDLSNTHQATLEERKDVIRVLMQHRAFNKKEKPRFNSKAEEAQWKSMNRTCKRLAAGEAPIPHNALIDELMNEPDRTNKS
jgi:hypothetical protein